MAGSLTNPPEEPRPGAGDPAQDRPPAPTISFPLSDSPGGGAYLPPPPRGRRWRATVLVTAGVLLLVALGVGAYALFFSGSRGGEEPRDAVAAFLQAARAHDLDGVKDALCASDRALAAHISNPESGIGLSAYTIGATTTVDATHATVRVTLVTDGRSQQDDLPVTKQDDGWRVCLSELKEDLPTPAPTG